MDDGALMPTRDASVDRIKDLIRRITGSEPPTCPWRAFQDPLVVDVINACRWYESGQVAVRIGAEPPYNLVEGVETFIGALELVDAEREKRRDEERKSKARAAATARAGPTPKARR